MKSLEKVPPLYTKSPIARLVPGKDYLSPNIELIIDDILEQKHRQKLITFLDRWIKNKIDLILKSLIELKDLREKNSSIKALAYQLYENNGVLKRDQVSELIKKGIIDHALVIVAFKLFDLIV